MVNVPDLSAIRAAAVGDLRGLADELERLPLERARDLVVHLGPSLLSVHRWAALARATVRGEAGSGDAGPKTRVEPMEEAEAAAAIAMGHSLPEHFRLADGVLNLINAVIGAAPEVPMRQVPLSRLVVTGLLVRIANDLRCVTMSALGGYALQAASLVASTYEVACAAVVIHSSDDLARTWLDHEDPTNLPAPFNSVPEMTRKALRLLMRDAPEDQLTQHVDTAYQAYRQFCMAKHANPLVQAEHGFVINERELAAVVGPFTGRNAERVAAFALEHAAACAIWALASFVGHHLPQEARERFKGPLQDLAERRHALHELMVRRGWNKDPAPGRWKLPSEKARKPPRAGTTTRT